MRAKLFYFLIASSYILLSCAFLAAIENLPDVISPFPEADIFFAALLLLRMVVMDSTKLRTISGFGTASIFSENSSQLFHAKRASFPYQE